MPSRNRGRQKPKLADLSKVPPTTEERKAVRDALRRDESPIATAILGATIVEFELESELRSRFRRKDDATWGDLTSDIGPLASFHQKIVAAYALGILSESLRDACQTVRQIRNQFAHSKRLIAFDNALIMTALSTVALPGGKRSLLYKRLATVRAMKDGPRYAFFSLCLVLALDIISKRRKRESAAERARLTRRQKALTAALTAPPTAYRGALLGLLGGFPPVDPNETIAGKARAFGLPIGTMPPGK